MLSPRIGLGSFSAHSTVFCPGAHATWKHHRLRVRALSSKWRSHYNPRMQRVIVALHPLFPWVLSHEHCPIRSVCVPWLFVFLSVVVTYMCHPWDCIFPVIKSCIHIKKENSLNQQIFIEHARHIYWGEKSHNKISIIGEILFLTYTIKNGILR